MHTFVEPTPTGWRSCSARASPVPLKRTPARPLRRELHGPLVSPYRDRGGFYVVLTNTGGWGSWRWRTWNL